MMKKSLQSRRSNCPIACALDFVGDKWTLVVLRDIIMARKCYFQELLAGNEAIASNILASRLKLLEAAGMITRRRDPAQAKRVIYEPTDKALDLLPVMIELIRWSMKYDPNAAAPAHFARRLAKDCDGFIADIRAMHNRASPRSALKADEGARHRDSTHRPRVARRGHRRHPPSPP
jgi:DNA-binding HxlR family transcriptional regulator